MLRGVELAGSLPGPASRNRMHDADNIFDRMGLILPHGFGNVVGAKSRREGVDEPALPADPALDQGLAGFGDHIIAGGGRFRPDHHHHAGQGQRRIDLVAEGGVGFEVFVPPDAVALRLKSVRKSLRQIPMPA